MKTEDRKEIDPLKLRQQIGDKAYQLYQARQARGITGSPHADWLQAEREILKPAGVSRSGFRKVS
jgi:hypothetical protein